MKLRALAKRCNDANQTRRLLALSMIYEGAKRTEAAKTGGVTLQVIRDWVLRFNAEGPAGLVDRKAPGAVPKLNEAHRAALARIVDEGPIPAVHGVVRWRIKDLVHWLYEEFGPRRGRDHGARGLEGHGLCQAFGAPAPSCPGRIYARGVHKTSPPRWRRSKQSLARVRP